MKIRQVHALVQLLAWGVVLGACAGCTGRGTARYIPSEDKARQALEAALNAWRETPFFTERERAALEWTEAVTRVADTQVPDEIFELVSAQFGEEELVALTFAVNLINSWNRLSISFRPVVGSYQPKAVAV